MNKLWKITGIIAVLVAVFAFAGVTATFAQGPNQPGGNTPPAVNQGQIEPGAGLGLQSVDEAEMHAAIADALGLTIAEFEAEVANGENLFTLAQKLGVDFAVVLATMDAVHEAALQQAIEDGLISLEQADWMLSRRGGQSGQSGQGAGMVVRGAGNNYNQTGDCLYLTP